MAYIDRDYLETVMSPGQVSASLLYGGTTPEVTESVCNNHMEASSNFVDFIIDAGGFQTPLEPAPYIIKFVTAQHCAKQLFIRAGVPVPEELNTAVEGTNLKLLWSIKTGEIPIPGFVPTNGGAAAGGHSVTDSSGSYGDTGSRGPFLDRDSLFGTYD